MKPSEKELTKIAEEYNISCMKLFAEVSTTKSTKQNELRIGNLVNRKYFNPQPENKNWQLEPVEICALGFGKYNVKLKNGGHSLIDYLEPIPLTEEWLLKFGFEKTMAWTFAIELKGNNMLVYYLGEKGCSIGFKSYSEFDCKYAHQLQNLYFALTNEELTINKL
jgi:hypothetical protein